MHRDTFLKRRKHLLSFLRTAETVKAKEVSCKLSVRSVNWNVSKFHVQMKYCSKRISLFFSCLTFLKDLAQGLQPKWQLSFLTLCHHQEDYWSLRWQTSCTSAGKCQPAKGWTWCHHPSRISNVEVALWIFSGKLEEVRFSDWESLWR